MNNKSMNRKSMKFLERNKLYSSLPLCLLKSANWVYNVATRLLELKTIKINMRNKSVTCLTNIYLELGSSCWIAICFVPHTRVDANNTADYNDFAWDQFWANSKVPLFDQKRKFSVVVKQITLSVSSFPFKVENEIPLANHSSFSAVSISFIVWETTNNVI